MYFTFVAVSCKFDFDKQLCMYFTFVAVSCKFDFDKHFQTSYSEIYTNGRSIKIGLLSLQANLVESSGILLANGKICPILDLVDS